MQRFSRRRAGALVAAVLGLALAVPQALPASAGTVRDARAAVKPAASVLDEWSGFTRLSGGDRYETAVAIARRYEPGVAVAYVAAGTDFPDALSAAAAAALAGGPLLLTPTGALPARVRAELKRLAPAQIRVVGGPAAVGATVQADLARIAPVKRLGGADRYATGLAVVNAAFRKADHAIIATGRTFPDALAASGAAGARRAPVVLVDGTRSAVDAKVTEALARLGVTSVTIAGGPGAVSAGIQTQLERAGLHVTRYGGADRYETAALITRGFFSAGSADSAFLATGADFPDALAGAALAGKLAAPLNITLRSCAHPAIADAIDQIGAPNRFVLGGAAVVSDAAAANARCVYPVTTEPLRNWATTGWTLSTDQPLPYTDRPPIDVHSPSRPVDATGLAIYRRADTGERADHPVAYAQYGLSALVEYQRTGTTMWLDRAKRNAQRLVDIRVERDGAWWYPYRFPWSYYGRVMQTPWWSAMAQGEALSLFTRLAATTGDPKWQTAAARTFGSFSQSYSPDRPWSSLVIDRHLYLEEYAGNQPPLLVLNGQMFAAFGLYDYWRATGDPRAAQLFDGAVTTVVDRMLPLVRVQGSVSYYCVQAEYCASPLWQNQSYHVIHSWQLDTLARLTGDQGFAEWAQVLRDDWSPEQSMRRMAPDEPGLPGPPLEVPDDAEWIMP
ncbi:hypothetical protein FLP10_05025 [Agromyces intestinalis]|uniref:D-glucuronyl C5-epimerase C-terminal domain-containing protein n=1 Tax=Agromyces intestinalis TaxID=2592652 RepID=A0A5C1YEH7_9MICO|nr:cell wall-binding repeat-containing protein [Agromyces intestinalis]QEO13855.1 hypothetical protein FLP10_05025 [Agromyces intestinalis]